MDKKITRAFINPNKCVLGMETGPQSIVVREVIGERRTQKVLDIQVRVPDRKPAIEQIIDVFVKNLKILHIDVITDRLIVRGELEVKAIYVADLPDQPVHAMEVKNYRFSQEVDVPGARRGMDADASVTVEFVDYNVSEFTRAYKYKNFEHMCPSECEEDYEEECVLEVADCEEECEEPCAPVSECATRDFSVSVVLSITAKVMADREVLIGYIPPAPMPMPMPTLPVAEAPAPKPATKPAAPKPKLPPRPKG